MIKKHLLEGVKKGAFDEAEADRRFNEWLKAKEEKIETKKSGIEKKGEETRIVLKANAAAMAVKLVHEGRAKALMKGHLHTGQLVEWNVRHIHIEDCISRQ